MVDALKDQFRHYLAGIVLVILAVSIAHGAAPHHPARHDCLACQALHAFAPALARASFSLPILPSSALSQELSAPPPAADVRGFRPLRAPPSFPAA
jgi:hypothetical protein